MTRTELITAIRTGSVHLDDLLNLPNTMTKAEVGRVLVDLYVGLSAYADRYNDDSGLWVVADELKDFWED